MRKPWASWTLRHRLILIASFVMVAALLVGGMAMYSAAEIEDRQMLDARLEQLGATILAFAESGEVSGANGGNAVATRPTSALLYRYQIWTPRGRLILRSHEAPDRPMADLNRFGFATVQLEGEEYRTFSLPTRDGLFVIQVAECLSERQGQLALVTMYYVGFLILPFGLIFGATWLLLRRSLRAVRSIATQLTNRNPLDVTRLEVENPPQEMLPVLLSIDALFERIGQAISVERRFTSFAAHELRTPLAGLRAHAQLAVSASNAEESRDALAAVIEGVDRASHLLTQLLDIARIEGMPKDGDFAFREFDVAAVCAGALRDIGPLAAKKGVSVTCDFRVERFQAQLLGVSLIVRNLVANAVLYSPVGGSVRISTAREDGLAVLIVDDSGPGIAAEDRERAFERFNRLGRRDVQGVGLGLSIVLMAVELHRAKITLLDSPLGGLRCRILFSAAKVAPEGRSSTDLVPA
jgi:two-component system OmpR family sensor kinase/two-component system sensor histidine kinase QseC